MLQPHGCPRLALDLPLRTIITEEYCARNPGVRDPGVETVEEKWSVLTSLKNYAQLELQVRTCGLRSADARLGFKLGAA